MKRTSLILLALSIFAFSCKKDDAPKVCATTIADIAGSYKITKVMATISGFGTTDITATALPDACRQSGVYQLNADRTLIYSENASCSSSGSGSWNLSADSSITISHNGGGLDFDGKVKSFNCTNLVINEETGGGNSVEYTITKQ